MGRIRNLLASAGLSALLLFGSGCSTKIGSEPLKEKTQVSYGARDLGNGRVYFGAFPDKIKSYENVLDAIKRKENSGSIFVGFNDDEIKIAQEVVRRYNSVNHKLIDRLEPVFVKVKGYNATPEEKSEFEELIERIKKLNDEDESLKVFELYPRLFELEPRVNPFLGRAHPNIKDLEKYVGSVGRFVYEVYDGIGEKNSGKDELTEFASDAINDVRKKANSWASGEILEEFLNRIRKHTQIKDDEDGFDIVYWTGVSTDRRSSLETLAHEVGHLIDFDNRALTRPISGRFRELSESEEDYLTNYSMNRSELARTGLKNPVNGFLAKLPEIVARFESSKSINKESIDGTQSLLGIGVSVMEDVSKQIEKIDGKVSLTDEDKERRKKLIESRINMGNKITEMKEGIAKDEEEIKLYDEAIRRTKEFTDRDDIKKAANDYAASVEQTDNSLLWQEDMAEAFAHALLGERGRTKNAQKKIELILDFMRKYN
ncbi:MAG: hypothetical protein AABY16_00595 [Nanoarchaeota archaeon]